MPSRILLADKSITIQKVVEMLFSGKEFMVSAVSDGEAALAEAARITPDVVLADMDLPRLDGYSLSTRLHQNPQFARTPVILMLSRDDVYDDAKARQAGIVDHIAKPFESQDLISKVRNAVASSPPHLGEGAAQPRPAAAPDAAPRTVAPAPPPPPPSQQPKSSVPSDIFDIIQEAPSRPSAAAKAPAPVQSFDDAVFEVEPVVEMEQSLPKETTRILPVGELAREEMRAGLGLAAGSVAPPVPGIEALGAVPVAEGPAPRAASPGRQPAAPSGRPSVPAAAPGVGVSDDAVRAMAEDIVSRLGREVLERVAWEIIPQLAETLIREEIERLKAETLPK